MLNCRQKWSKNRINTTNVTGLMSVGWATLVLKPIRCTLITRDGQWEPIYLYLLVLTNHFIDRLVEGLFLRTVPGLLRILQTVPLGVPLLFPRMDLELCRRTPVRGHVLNTEGSMVIMPCPMGTWLSFRRSFT